MISKLMLKHNPQIKETQDNNKSYLGQFLYESFDDISKNNELENATLFYNSKISTKVNKDFQESEQIIQIPKNVYVTTNERHRKLENIRQRLRKNHFDHQNFDPQIQTRDSQKYFEGVYKLNQTIDDEYHDSIPLIAENNAKYDTFEVENQSVFFNNGQRAQFCKEIPSNNINSSSIYGLGNDFNDSQNQMQTKNLSQQLFWQFKHNQQVPNLKDTPLEVKRSIIDLTQRQKSKFETLNKNSQMRQQLKEIEHLLDSGYEIIVQTKSKTDLLKQKEEMEKASQQLLIPMKKKLTQLKAEKRAQALKQKAKQLNSDIQSQIKTAADEAREVSVKMGNNFDGQTESLMTDQTMQNSNQQLQTVSFNVNLNIQNQEKLKTIEHASQSIILPMRRGCLDKEQHDKTNLLIIHN
ncbi:UNKNOWN [Stylonychia lemnae]|uniref:Uncharacterized protein n=1 Tax=Stylonychia lemnae TaxID=5949 RepID=A0A077ZMY2_STYLE|nr:UNKNOWN [Stylonychia lemnae]|eukprot:CDW71288.1 UNKNOWN [Stylonychia lemnae]